MALLKNTSNLSPFSPAEKLTRADDLMSDVLDCFLWPSPADPSIPYKRTIKFTDGYRRPRALNINDFRSIIHSVQTGRLRNLTEATTLVRQLPAVVSYITNAEPPRLGKHIGLYLQLFLPRCGVRFSETNRYDQRKGNSQDSHNPQHTGSPISSGSQFKRFKSKIRPNELRDLLSSAHPTPSSSKLTSARSNQLDTSPNHLTHLAVFATKDYSPNDVVIGCEGSFADLTEQEDLKLRSNAHLPIHSHQPSHVHRPSTDFSHIVNSRGKFQVFCGPARFVNHDCNNNVELLREGFTIKFKVIKPIKVGQEILTSYGMNYFGEKNCECMCATCERNGAGFYSSSQEKNSRVDSNFQSVEKEHDLQIKKEFEESNLSFPPNLGTDVTDLSSMVDGSDETLSRVSNPSTLEQSPTMSFSNTPSQVRRQLALPSSQHLDALLETKLQSHSRSSLTRRNRQGLSEHTQKNLNSPDFNSPFKFVPTHDLTLPVLSSTPLAQDPTPKKVIMDFETSIPQQSPSLTDPKIKSEEIAFLPIKKKTYWITTKQKQLGLLPWESESIITPPSTLVSTVQSYSPQTPSSLNPSKRKLDIQQAMKKKTKPNSEETEKIPQKAPARSYWVSTKDKQLGIVPWETNQPTEAPSGLTDSNQVATPSTSMSRSTRASRKASLDTPDITRFPIAPRGSKLSYKVFQKGTPEAELLNTAIGRELLGFRPRVVKKKQVPQLPQQQQQHEQQQQQHEQQQQQHEQQQQQHEQQQQQHEQQQQQHQHQHQHQYQYQYDGNSNPKEHQIEVLPAVLDSKNYPSQVTEYHAEGAIIDTLEEISSFLMDHPEPTTAAAQTEAAIQTTQNTTNRSHETSTGDGKIVQANQKDTKSETSKNNHSSNNDELVQNQPRHVAKKANDHVSTPRLKLLLSSRPSNSAQKNHNDFQNLIKKNPEELTEEKRMAESSGVVPELIDDDGEQTFELRNSVEKLNKLTADRIATTTKRAEGPSLDDAKVEMERRRLYLSSASPEETCLSTCPIEHTRHAFSRSRSNELVAISQKLKDDHPGVLFINSDGPVHHQLSVNTNESSSSTSTAINSLSQGIDTGNTQILNPRNDTWIYIA